MPSKKFLFVSYDGVMIPHMYYREDVGDRWSEEDSDRLHAWGYSRE